jgi:hypothetical protein
MSDRPTTSVDRCCGSSVGSARMCGARALTRNHQIASRSTAACRFSRSARSFNRRIVSSVTDIPVKFEELDAAGLSALRGVRPSVQSLVGVGPAGGGGSMDFSNTSRVPFVRRPVAHAGPIRVFCALAQSYSLIPFNQRRAGRHGARRWRLQVASRGHILTSSHAAAQEELPTFVTVNGAVRMGPGHPEACSPHKRPLECRRVSLKGRIGRSPA